MKKFIILGFVCGLTACGGISEITPDVQYQTESQLPAIDTGMGQLCIFRVSNMTGMAVALEMLANDKYIGRLPNSSYFCANLIPDEYIITGTPTWNEGNNRASAETIVRAGTRKYMELQVGMNMGLSTTTRELGLAGIHSVK